MTGVRAPNRLFNFEDLDEGYWRRTLREMEELFAGEDVFYLHPSKRWEYPWALKRAGQSPGSRVLDAGCGGSIFPVYLASIGMQTTACDILLPPGIDRLHRTFIQYIREDLTALPLADSAFDAIFCISVMEHLEEKGAVTALRELRRVLRSGGRLLLTTDYCKNNDAEIWYEAQDRRFLVDWHLFDERRLKSFLRSGGRFRTGRGTGSLSRLGSNVRGDEPLSRLSLYHRGDRLDQGMKINEFDYLKIMDCLSLLCVFAPLREEASFSPSSSAAATWRKKQV